MLALLAPVPAVHLPDAFKVKNADGVVAFGTGDKSGKSGGEWSFSFFSQDDLKQGQGNLPVLIYGSATDLKGPNSFHHAGFVTALAVYQRVREAKAGKHPIPEYRPASALSGDTDWIFFWEVCQLTSLAKGDHIPLASLKLKGTGKLKAHSGSAPHGPELVVLSSDCTKFVSKRLKLK
jgi:hypothetical protein